MSIVIGTITKDPDDLRTVSIDWSPYLPSGVTVSTYSVTDVDSDLTAASATNDTTSSSVVISGGVAGRYYYVTHRATFDNSDVRDVQTIIAVV